MASNNPEKNDIQLDIDKVLESMNIAHQIITKNNSQHMNGQGESIVIFWGYSGTGKSAAIIVLNGQGVKGHSEEGYPVLIQQKPITQGKGVRIQPGVVAGTIYPAVLQMSKLNPKDKTIKLWDMPGLGENRGATQSLINNYFIHRIFQFYKKVKLVFTIDFNKIKSDNKGAQIQAILKNMLGVLGELQNYEKGIAVMVTKTPYLLNEDNVIKLFENILNKVIKINQDHNYNKIITLIVERKIPIFLVKVPKLQNTHHLITRNEAIDVTPQYKETIRKSYNVINSLESVSIPKINTAMTPAEIESCKPIIQDAQIKIKKIISDIKMKLYTYIHNNRDIVFQNNFQKDNENYERWIKMTKFIEAICLCVNGAETKDTLTTNFDKLKQIFEVQGFQTILNKQSNKKECKQMRDLLDQCTIINFMGSVISNKDKIKFKWQNSQDIILQFFKQIKTLNLNAQLQQQRQKIKANLHTFTKNYFKQQILDKLKGQQFYIDWKQDYKRFPYLIKSLTEHQNLDEIKYYQKIKKNLDDYHITSGAMVKNIINRLNCFKECVQNSMDISFVAKDIIPLIIEQNNRLIKECITQTDLEPSKDSLKKNKNHKQTERQLTEHKQKIKNLITSEDKLSKQLNIKKQQLILKNNELTKNIKNQQFLEKELNNYQQKLPRVEKDLSNAKQQNSNLQKKLLLMQVQGDMQVAKYKSLNKKLAEQSQQNSKKIKSQEEQIKQLRKIIFKSGIVLPQYLATNVNGQLLHQQSSHHLPVESQRIQPQPSSSCLLI